MTQGRLHHVMDPDHVGVEHQRPILVSGLCQGSQGGSPGAVDNEIELAEVVGCVCHHAPAIIAIPHISGDGRRTFLCLDYLCQPLGATRGDHHVGTAPKRSEGERTADTGRGAYDQHPPACETAL
jgi:hypothetical protein